MNTTTSIGDNFSFSIGTETQQSDNLNDIQNGGFWPFSSNGDVELVTSMALDAFNERRIKEGSYLLANAARRGIHADLSKKDDAGRNLLHLLVLYSAYDPEVKEILLHTLDRSDIKKYINCQDKQLNTVAHYALSLKMMDVLKVLVDKQVDLSLKNNQDFYIRLVKTPVSDDAVVKASPDEATDGHKNIFVKCATKSVSAPVVGSVHSVLLPVGSAGSDIGRELDNIVNMFLKKDTDTERLSFDRRDVTETAKAPQHSEDIDSVNFLSDLMRQFRDTRRPLKPLEGGAKRSGVTTGRRRLNTYSEISIGGGSTSSSSDSESDVKLSKLARSVKNKANEIHEEVQKKIAEIMNVPDDVARNYKSALYQKVKAEQPGLSGYDRAIEMQKLATKDVLKKIDINKVTAEIKAHLEKKASSQSLSSTSESSDSSQSETPKKARKQKRISDSQTSDSGLITLSSFDD